MTLSLPCPESAQCEGRASLVPKPWPGAFRPPTQVLTQGEGGTVRRGNVVVQDSPSGGAWRVQTRQPREQQLPQGDSPGLDRLAGLVFHTQGQEGAWAAGLRPCVSTACLSWATSDAVTEAPATSEGSRGTAAWAILETKSSCRGRGTHCSRRFCVVLTKKIVSKSLDWQHTGPSRLLREEPAPC